MIEHNNIILFDGVCNLCNGFVQFVIKRDKKKLFKFASLQSNFGQEFLKKNNLPQQQFNSFVYIRNNEIVTKSSASLFVAKDLKGFISLTFGLIIFPKFMRNWVYDIVAKNRYKWFGKQNECWLPSEELKARFLE